MATEAGAPSNQPVFFVYLDVADDQTWIWTGAVGVTLPAIPADPLLSTSRTFIAGADIGSISNITHAADGTVKQIQLYLANADFTDTATDDFVNDVSMWSRRLAVVWIGYLDGTTFAPVASPRRLATCLMTHCATTDGAQPGITLTLSSQSAVNGQRANGWLLADAHQRTFYASDTALQYIPQMVGKELRFGSPDDKVSRGGGITRQVASRAQNAV